MTKKVIVLGGGVAGMSAAHELMERGFDVEVYEKHLSYPGGKARSVNVPFTNDQFNDKYLPGEHGFRFFPGFYKHITDTMKRIPFTNSKGTPNDNGVFDNLVAVSRVEIARDGRKPIQTVVNFPRSLDDVKALLDGLHAGTGLTEEEKQLFAFKVWQLMTSCHDRRKEEYERLGWWQYMDADNQSANYQHLLVEGLTRTLVAANAQFASTKTGGDIFLQLIFLIANPFMHADRVLNGPTNDVWLYPWHQYLDKGGVKYHYNAVVKGLNFSNGVITGARVSIDGNDPQEITGDYYILATPIEVAANIISPEMIIFDMTLGGLEKLAASVAWMNGLQFYLNQDVEVVHGHCIYADSPWAVTSISQLQFWNDYDLQVRGKGNVKGILSVDISNWQVVGSNGKMACDCTNDEIMKEVWYQMKQSLNNGAEVLTDDMIVNWYLDRDITQTENSKSDLEPLLVNTVNSWELRPRAYCRIPNLFFASDYVRTHTDLATMEGANEAARRAVNCIIDDSGVDAPMCEIWDLHEPDILMPFKVDDQKRYNSGLPYKYHEPILLKLAHWVKSLFDKSLISSN